MSGCPCGIRVGIPNIRYFCMFSPSQSQALPQERGSNLHQSCDFEAVLLMVASDLEVHVSR